MQRQTLHFQIFPCGVTWPAIRGQQNFWLFSPISFIKIFFFSSLDQCRVGGIIEIGNEAKFLTWFFRLQRYRHMIKSLVGKYALRTISTKTQSARHLVTMLRYDTPTHFISHSHKFTILRGLNKLGGNLNEFLVQVRAPETIYDLTRLHIMRQSRTLNAASLSRNVFKS